jgi:hypothetical protein
MLMPNFVDLFAGARVFISTHGKETEASIFEDGGTSEGKRPVPVSGQSLGEVQRGSRFEVMTFDP